MSQKFEMRRIAVSGKDSEAKKEAAGKNETMPLNKTNYILIAACLALIVLGFILMCGSSNEGATFNNDIFSNTRIVVAPFITFAGFVLMVWAILYKKKS